MGVGASGSQAGLDALERYCCSNAADLEIQLERCLMKEDEASCEIHPHRAPFPHISHIASRDDLTEGQSVLWSKDRVDGFFEKEVQEACLPSVSPFSTKRRTAGDVDIRPAKAWPPVRMEEDDAVAQEWAWSTVGARASRAFRGPDVVSLSKTYDEYDIYEQEALDRLKPPPPPPPPQDDPSNKGDGAGDAASGNSKNNSNNSNSNNSNSNNSNNSNGDSHKNDSSNSNNNTGQVGAQETDAPAASTRATARATATAAITATAKAAAAAAAAPSPSTSASITSPHQREEERPAGESTALSSFSGANGLQQEQQQQQQQQQQLQQHQKQKLQTRPPPPRKSPNSIEVPFESGDKKPLMLGAGEFIIELQRSVGAPLGLDVRLEGNFLIVKHITKGLVLDWNKRNPKSAVSVGDAIVEVNGIRGQVDLTSASRKSGLLRVVFLKNALASPYVPGPPTA